MEQLGERIKRLRKERKMTLAEVAGDKLTKGMLSLIENGKANPSMESLQHISKQLNIPLSELVQTEDSNTLRELLIKAESLLSEYKEAVSMKKAEEIQAQVLDMLDPIFQEREFRGTSYEEVRLYELYIEFRYHKHKEVEYDKYYRVIESYESIHAFSRLLDVYIFMALTKFVKLNYHEALEYLVEGEMKLIQYEHFIDPLEKLDFYYNITVMYAAVNDEGKMEHYLNLALKLSNEKKIFYRIDDFYRFLYYVSLQKNDEEKVEYYIRKLKEYITFVEDPIEKLYFDVIQLLHFNLIVKDYDYVINFKYDEENYPEVEWHTNAFLIAVKSYAYYHKGRYEEVINLAKDLTIPSFHSHPIDLAILYEAFAVRALSYYELGNLEEAKRDILYAYDGVKSFSKSIQKDFITRAFEKIMGNIA